MPSKTGWKSNGATCWKWQGSTGGKGEQGDGDASREHCSQIQGTLNDRPIYGEPFLRTALGFAPVNEMGVVFLFGAMAEKLGFIVTWIGTQYPDVEAFREVAPGRWQRVRIEVEFMSRNFLQHFHDPKDCDLIVCWENNWPECPLEVIALKDLMEGFGRAGKAE